MIIEKGSDGAFFFAPVRAVTGGKSRFPNTFFLKLDKVY